MFCGSLFAAVSPIVSRDPAFVSTGSARVWILLALIDVIVCKREVTLKMAVSSP